MDPSGMGRLIIGASPAVNSRGALRSSDCRWIVSRLSERYLFGRPAVCLCWSDDSFSGLTSRQSASEVCGLNAEATAGALSAGGVAGQRLATANTDNTASTRRSVLNEDG